MDLRLGPDEVVDVGAMTDARLAALAPRPPRPDSWWWAGESAAGGADGATPDGSGHVDDPSPQRLAQVRQVLHEATTVVTWTDGRRRGAFVVAGDVVLVDVLAGGLHHLTLAGIAAATAVLVIGLDPLDLARHGARPGHVAVRDAGTSDSQVGDAHRRSVAHIARVSTRPVAGEVVLTVVGRDDGLEVVRALPDGRTARRMLDRDAVVGAAVALLTGPAEAVAA